MDHRVPSEQYRYGWQWVCVALYYATATWLAMRSRPETTPASDPGIPVMAAVCTLVVLVICLSTEYVERPLLGKLRFTAVAMLFFGTFWSVMVVAGNLIGVSDPDIGEPHTRFGWAALAANTGVPVVVFALRNSRLLAKK